MPTITFTPTAHPHTTGKPHTMNSARLLIPSPAETSRQSAPERVLVNAAVFKTEINRLERRIAYLQQRVLQLQWVLLGSLLLVGLLATLKLLFFK